MWQVNALAALQTPGNDATYAIMSAWQRSTPLPPYSYNPLGTPAGMAGSKAYLTTRYSGYGSIGMFYAALSKFAATESGKRLARSMTADDPYPATWQVIASLKWPASATETDYPAVLLDMTSAEFRQSVNATARPFRKTSGLVIAPHYGITTTLAGPSSVHKATGALRGAANVNYGRYGRNRNG
jgi:hypothetical protein